MKLCADGHDEVCFEGHHCPMCYIYRVLDEVEKQLDEVKEKLSDAESEILVLQKAIPEIEDGRPDE